jgi:hypothetical protein
VFRAIFGERRALFGTPSEIAALAYRQTIVKRSNFPSPTASPANPNLSRRRTATATNNKREKTQAKTSAGESCPLRVKQVTRRKLQKILDAVNKKDFGKRVCPNAVIDLALSLVGAAEIEQLRQASMNNADRLEAAYRRYAAKETGTSKDDFLGLLLAGKVSITHGETGSNGGDSHPKASSAS